MNFIYYIMKDRVNMTWIQQYWKVKTAEKHLLVINTTSPRYQYHTTHINTTSPKKNLGPKPSRPEPANRATNRP